MKKIFINAEGPHKKVDTQFPDYANIITFIQKYYFKWTEICCIQVNKKLLKTVWPDCKANSKTSKMQRLTI